MSGDTTIARQLENILMREHFSDKNTEISNKTNEIRVTFKLKALFRPKRKRERTRKDQRTSGKDKREVGNHQKGIFAFAFAFGWCELTLTSTSVSEFVSTLKVRRFDANE